MNSSLQNHFLNSANRFWIREKKLILKNLIKSIIFFSILDVIENSKKPIKLKALEFNVNFLIFLGFRLEADFFKTTNLSIWELSKNELKSINCLIGFA